MALNKFILDMTEGSFQAWRDEVMAEQQQTHSQQMLYLQNIFKPREEYENDVTDFIQTNKTLRDDYIKQKTSASLHKWLSHYSTMPENSKNSEIYTALN